MVELQPKKPVANTLLWQVPLYGFAALFIFRGFQAFAEAPVLAVPLGLALIWMGLVVVPPTGKLLRRLPLPVHVLARAGAALFPLMCVGLVIASKPLPDGGMAKKAPPTAPASASRPSAMDDPEIRKILEDEAKKDEATKFAERIEPDLLPRVAAVETAQPSTMPDVWLRLGEIENLAVQVREGRNLNMSAAQKKELAKLEAALSAKQAVVLPRLRTAYRELSRSVLWERDIEVGGSGRMIEYVGSTFALNANIKAAEEIIEKDLIRLRFTAARYRWMRGGEWWQYKLNSPPDTEILT